MRKNRLRCRSKNIKKAKTDEQVRQQLFYNAVLVEAGKELRRWVIPTNET